MNTRTNRPKKEFLITTAQVGDRVRIQYSRLPERAAKPGGPKNQKTLEFTAGSGEVFPGLSFGVVGMSPGERKRFTLQPRDAYGDIEPKLIRKIPRQRFPKHVQLHVGKRLTAVHGSAGHRRRVTVIEIEPDSVVVDGNHPLAGKVVKLEISLLSLDSSAAANRGKPQFDMGGES
jgi:FKBP-type peptidyl-prolyl cis-trans isomerase 2